MKKLLLCLALFGTLNMQVQAQPAEAPFSDAVRVGSVLYLSGQTAAEEEGVQVPPGIMAQTKQTMDNIKRILQRNGLDMMNVKKCTIMLANIQDWSGMNNVYKTYFPANAYPARTTFGNAGLAPGYLIQIDCIASFPENS